MTMTPPRLLLRTMSTAVRDSVPAHVPMMREPASSSSVKPSTIVAASSA